MSKGRAAASTLHMPQSERLNQRVYPMNERQNREISRAVLLSGLFILLVPLLISWLSG